MLRILFLSLLFCFSYSVSFSSFACIFEQVSFNTNFPGGHIGKCQQLDSDRYLLTLIPENTPINDSPWYAFNVTAKQATTIKVLMKVEGSQHRYPPKISRDGKKWQLQPYKLKKQTLTMTLNVDEQNTWISAQEIISNESYYQWAEQLAKQTDVSHMLLAWSPQQRPIYKLESKGQGNEWLVILGRQHPPEITGAMAMLSFVDTLFSDSTIAKKFKQRFNILVVPNVNPDGVYLGNWRHNANGIDLNRDWKTFSQPEVAAVNNTLLSIVKQKHKIKMAVDFHSTKHPIFYTMPSDYGVQDPTFVERWLTALDQQYPTFSVKQKPGNNPGKGVFKQYIADTFKVHAITYEMGDNTDRYFIKKLAHDAATTLMAEMLLTPKIKNTQ